MCACFVEASSYENNTSCFFETFGNRLCTAFSKACDMLDKTNAELQLLFSSLLLSFSKISGLAIQISTILVDLKIMLKIHVVKRVLLENGL